MDKKKKEIKETLRKRYAFKKMNKNMEMNN